ncbi:MAG: ABC transporter permease [Lachnospiraceae bacterium]|nr:ABC transporter permease [Lachnospiraceae bacterium]
MSNKQKLVAALGILLVILLNIGILNWHGAGGNPLAGRMTLRSDISDNVQVFYSGEEKSFGESASTIAPYPAEDGKVGDECEIDFTAGTETSFLRIDFGAAAGSWDISGLEASYKGATDAVDLEKAAANAERTDISNLSVRNGVLHVEANAGDPHIVIPVDFAGARAASMADAARSDMIVRILALLLLDGACVAAVLFRKKFLTLPIEIFENRQLIFKLASNDFKTKYAGSYLGIIWAFIQPIVTVLVYWFVFSVGFRSGRVSDVPFVVYLVCGLVPWFYIQDLMNSGTNALIEYSYLVKKVVFKISVLPMVKAISALFVHAFFVLLTIVIAALYRIWPSAYTLQVIYYFFCMFVFGLGITYGTCAIVIFFRDLSQIINIILQIGVWTIPIMWNLDMIPAKYQFIFKINPMFYVINGYRQSVYGHVWFWQDLKLTIYFWAVTGILFVIGSVIFKRLKIHFADVL